MSRSTRLTLLGAAVMLALAGPVCAQERNTAGPADAPPEPAEAQPAPRTPNSQSERPSPGCPYRDGKLELIV